MIATNEEIMAVGARIVPAKQEQETSEAGKKTLLHNKQVKGPSKYENTTRSGSKPLSSFLALPVELHLRIILDQDLAHSIDPGLLNLRETNIYFWSIPSFADLYT